MLPSSFGRIWKIFAFWVNVIGGGTVVATAYVVGLPLWAAVIFLVSAAVNALGIVDQSVNWIRRFATPKERRSTTKPVQDSGSQPVARIRIGATSHPTMRGYTLLAAMLVFVGAALAVWLLPDPRGWGDLELKDRLPLATLMVGLLALLAALVTILAAVAEVRHVFPTQAVRVTTISRQYVRIPDALYETHQIIFENPSDSPMINTSRIYIRLVRASAQIADADWSLQPNCVRYATSEHKPLVGDDTEAIEIPTREAPYPGTWLPTRVPFYIPVFSENLDWVLERENPWFPSILIQGPKIALAWGASLDEYRWIVTWWTERQGPVSLVERI